MCMAVTLKTAKTSLGISYWLTLCLTTFLHFIQICSNAKYEECFCLSAVVWLEMGAAIFENVAELMQNEVLGLDYWHN